MNNWRTSKLGDIVKSGGGKIHTGPFGSQLHASDYVPSGIPCIMPANMKDNRVDLLKISFIAEDDAKRLSKYLVQGGDIVYSRRGDVTLKALIRSEETGYFCGTGCLLLRPGNEIDPEFLTYYLSTTTMKDWIKKQAVGATMPNINTDILSNIPFTGPEKQKQKQIASVLYSFDKKIALNNKINTELEAMAKLIYDYWFVQFDFPDANGKPYKSSGGKMVYNEALKREIPEGWSDGTLHDLGEIVGGSTPSTKQAENFKDKGTPWITPKDLSNNTGNKFIARGGQDVSAEGVKSASLRLYPKDTVLMSSRAPIGYMAIARESLTTNQGFKSFIPNKGYSMHYIYYAIKNSMNAIVQNSSGSTFKEVSGSVLKTVKVCLPKYNIVENYVSKVNCIFDRQNLLELENEELVELRDWLLPMLMNGQVTVKCS